MNQQLMREYGEKCRRLADIATNRDVRRALDELAREFRQQADALEAQHRNAAEHGT
jgi:hypothetical protein